MYLVSRAEDGCAYAKSIHYFNAVEIALLLSDGEEVHIARNGVIVYKCRDGQMIEQDQHELEHAIGKYH